jgi:hypothetical protein
MNSRLPVQSDAIMPNNKITKISKKEHRTIEFALNRFFGRKSFTSPTTISDFKVPHLLTRELTLSNHRVLLMTEVGLGHIRTIVKTMHAADQVTLLPRFSLRFSTP